MTTQVQNTKGWVGSIDSKRAARTNNEARLPAAMFLRNATGDLMVNERETETAILELVRTIQSRVERPSHEWEAEALPSFAYRDTTENHAQRVNGGMPALVLSQLHWGAVATETSRFDARFAARRLSNVFVNTADILVNQMAGRFFDGICVAMSGNLFADNIVLSMLNADHAAVSRSVESLSYVLAESIRMLADQFPEVYVPCVLASSKGTFQTNEERAAQSLDRLVYRMLKAQLADLVDEQRVIIEISATGHATFELLGHSFTLSSHAPQKPSDDRYFLAGHVAPEQRHTNVFGGGSLKGSAPSQMLVIAHRRHGVVSTQFVSARVEEEEDSVPLFRRMSQPSDELRHLATTI